MSRCHVQKGTVSLVNGAIYGECHLRSVNVPAALCGLCYIPERTVHCDGFDFACV